MTKWILSAVAVLCSAVSVFAQAAPDLPAAARRSAQGLDALFLQFADNLPGFAGYFYNESGDLVVQLTDRGDEHAARVLLAETARTRPQRWKNPWARPAQIIIQHAQFDFAQLQAVRARVAADSAILAEIPSFDTNEVTNEVVLGVTSEEARQRVLARVAALQLPANAIRVEVAPRATFITNLSNSVRPVVGGLAIQFTDTVNVPPGTSQVRDCTLGANVLYGNATQGIATGTPGFYTASHCHPTQGTNDGVEFRQGGTRIGQQRYDPQNFSFLTSIDCPYQTGNTYCRYSDVTFATYDQTVSRKQGYLAQTLKRGTGAYNMGSTDLAVLGTWQFTATGTVLPTVGMTLEKVGENTGWTGGAVIAINGATCADEPAYNLAGQTVYILCSTKVDAYADGGDSGGPVFRILSNNNVEFAGIVWGKTGTGQFFFSDVNQIAKSMGTDVQYTP